MSSWHWYGRDDGRSGLEWAVRVTDTGIIEVWIPGTDHVDDVRHHLKIGLVEAANGIWVTRADLLLVADIIRELPLGDKPLVRVAGHSWGAAVGALLVWVLRRRGITARGWLYGPKLAGNQRFVREVSRWITAYRHRFDWVPYLTPWLALFRMHRIGRMTWPWKAHLPRAYEEVMEADGF